MINVQILSLYEKAKIIKDKDSLLKIVKNRTKSLPIAFDTETTSEEFNKVSYLLSHRICNGKEIKVCLPYQRPYVFGISMAMMVQNRVHLLWARYNTEIFKTALSIIKKSYWKVAHNARYDIRVLEEGKYKVGGDVECTYTMSRIYWDRRMKHSLKALAEFLCPELSNWNEPIKEEMSRLKREYRGHKVNPNFSFISDIIMSKYSMLDSFWALILWMYLTEKAIWKK